MDDIIKAIEHLHEEISDINEHVSKIDKQIELLKKSPDTLFKEEWMDGQDCDACPEHQR